MGSSILKSNSRFGVQLEKFKIFIASLVPWRRRYVSYVFTDNAQWLEIKKSWPKLNN